jgi:hypothetical protein
VNKVGGVERTNLPFIFGVSSGDVFAGLDTVWFIDAERFEQDLELAGKLTQDSSQWADYSNSLVETAARLKARQPELTALLRIDSSKLPTPHETLTEAQKAETKSEIEKLYTALDGLDQLSDSDLASRGLPNKSEARRRLLLKLKEAYKTTGVEMKFVMSPEGKLTLEPQ